MQQDIGTIISKGFTTWTRNLNISLPIILNFGISVLLIMVTFVAFVVFFVMPKFPAMDLDPANILPEHMIGILSSVVVDNIIIIIAGFIVIMVLITFIESYFLAGAIGMAKIAMKTGDTHLSDMYLYGNKNAVNLFWTNILIMLIIFAGIIFVVPGVLVMGNLNEILSNPDETAGSLILFLIGFLVWIFYIMIVTIILSIVKFALVVENLDPISALETGYKFFMNNKLDVLLMWLILIAISLFFSIISESISSVPVLSTLWTFINVVLSIVIIPTLTIVWWTRLYLIRTGRKIYDTAEMYDDY